MISFSGLLLAVLFLLFFAWLFMSAYSMGMNGRDYPGKKSITAFCVYSFVGAVLLYYLAIQEHTVHISDWWVRSYNNMIMLFSKPLLAVLRLGGTMLFGEYNTLPCMITAFPLKLFGYTYIRYILVNYMCFFVPACFILFSMLKKISGREYNALFMFLTFMFVPIHIHRIGGFVDTVCLIPAGLAVLLIDGYDASSFSREQIKRDVYISVLLLLSMLFRRYFAFFIVGYMSGLALLSLYQILRSESRFKAFINAVLNIAVIGFTALVIMIVFLGPLLYRILMNKYSVLYVEWDAPLKDKILGIPKICGWFPFIFAFIGLILSFIRKRYRKYASFCVLSSVATIASFFTIQAMNIFQTYTFIVQLFILSCIGIIHIIELLKSNSVMKKIAVSFFLLVFTADFLNCYFPAVRTVLGSVSNLFCEVHNPVVKHDLDSLHELAEYTNAITDGTTKGVYVIDGPSMNEYIMEYLYRPYKPEGLNNHIKGRGDDLLDGFPVSILNADIIIASFADNDDYIMVRRVIANELNDSNSIIGRHFFRHERAFSLDDGATAYVFEKKSDFTDDDLQELADYFTELYPGKEDIYSQRILGRMNQWDIQDHRNRSLAVRGLKYLLEKKIFTAEELAAIADRSVDEINILTK